MNPDPEVEARSQSQPDPESPGPEAAGSSVEQLTIEQAPIGFDQLFEILKNQRRRRVLRYLIEDDDGGVTLDELAEEIAARETGKDVRQITSQERKRVYVGLYQCHLPKMDDYGAIAYNKPRGKIETADQTDLFERYLSVEDDADDSGWTEYHSMLSLVAAVVLVVPVVLGAIGSNTVLHVVTALLVGALAGVSAFRYFR